VRPSEGREEAREGKAGFFQKAEEASFPKEAKKV
jgi:hypothetical protein